MDEPGGKVLWSKPWRGSHTLVPATIVRENRSRAGFKVIIEYEGRQRWVYRHTLFPYDETMIGKNVKSCYQFRGRSVAKS